MPLSRPRRWSGSPRGRTRWRRTRSPPGRLSPPQPSLKPKSGVTESILGRTSKGDEALPASLATVTIPLTALWGTTQVMAVSVQECYLRRRAVEMHVVVEGPGSAEIGAADGHRVPCVGGRGVYPGDLRREAHQGDARRVGGGDVRGHGGVTELHVYRAQAAHALQRPGDGGLVTLPDAAGEAGIVVARSSCP